MVSLRRLARILAHLEWHSHDRKGSPQEASAAADTSPLPVQKEQLEPDPARTQKQEGSGQENAVGHLLDPEA